MVDIGYHDTKEAAATKMVYHVISRNASAVIGSNEVMNAREILTTLKTLGKPQTAAIYRRHGSGDNVFGALTSEIARIAKKIKIDHTLATDLWQTGNAEARVLALLIMDPQKLTRADADRFIEEGPAHFLFCYSTNLVARSPIADKAMRDWMKSSDESFREIGYSLLAVRLKDDPDSITDAECEKVLATIEKQIHRSPNWARYAMNGALISIGVFKPTLQAKAIESAKRIGKVDVDHGETTCKTPDAVPYIEKAAKRRRKRCP